MNSVREHAKLTEGEIRSTFEKMISTVTGLLRDREAVLIGNVETARHQKEKELQLQKGEFEFLLSGIRHAVLFSEAMVKEGGETEIAAGHPQVITRMTTLSKERKKVQLEPVTDAEIGFVGGLATLSEVIKKNGAVVTKDISLEQSIIERPIRVNHQSNEAYYFKVILVDRKGSKASRDIFTPTEVGLHQVSVTFRGNHLQESPFNFEVVDRPVYRRDYNEVGDKLIKRFGSKGAGDGQFDYPVSVTSNSRGKLLLLI